MSFLFNAIALLLLGVVFVQDLRARAVSIILFPLLLGCFTCMALAANAVAEVLEWASLNVLFLTLQLVLLYLYFWLKNRGYTAVVGQSMGWGDILFWLVACVLFSPANFILFFLSSLVFSLVLHLVLSRFSTAAHRATVPLAGYQALCLALALGVQQLLPGVNFHDDYLLLGFLI